MAKGKGYSRFMLDGKSVGKKYEFKIDGKSAGGYKSFTPKAGPESAHMWNGNPLDVQAECVETDARPVNLHKQLGGI